VVEGAGEAVEDRADAAADPDTVRAPRLDAEGLLAGRPPEAVRIGADVTDATHSVSS
jgi:hypothetical protein